MLANNNIDFSEEKIEASINRLGQLFRICSTENISFFDSDDFFSNSKKSVMSALGATHKFSQLTKYKKFTVRPIMSPMWVAIT
jgi:hypothetical protein